MVRKVEARLLKGLNCHRIWVAIMIKTMTVNAMTALAGGVMIALIGIGDVTIQTMIVHDVKVVVVANDLWTVMIHVADDVMILLQKDVTNVDGVVHVRRLSLINACRPRTQCFRCYCCHATRILSFLRCLKLPQNIA